MENIIQMLINYLQSTGLIGGFLLVLLESIIPIMPLAIFIGFNVLAFGNFTGFVISWVGTVIGCMVSFSLFRYLLKNLFYKIFKENTRNKVEKFMQKISDIDFNALVVLVAMPFTPAFIINIAAGLSNINWKKYFIAILIGKLSIIYFWGYIGSNLLDGIKDPITILKMIGLILIAYLISKIIEKIVKVEE